MRWVEFWVMVPVYPELMVIDVTETSASMLQDPSLELLKVTVSAGCGVVLPHEVQLPVALQFAVELEFHTHAFADAIPSDVRQIPHASNPIVTHRRPCRRPRPWFVGIGTTSTPEFGFALDRSEAALVGIGPDVDYRRFLARAKSEKGRSPGADR